MVLSFSILIKAFIMLHNVTRHWGTGSSLVLTVLPHFSLASCPFFVLFLRPCGEIRHERQVAVLHLLDRALDLEWPGAGHGVGWVGASPFLGRGKFL